MKSASSWKFSAPLTKVDLPRICDEAAEDTNDVYPIGVIKVVVDVGNGQSIAFVLADSDVAAHAHTFRGVRVPDAILSNEVRLQRAPGGILSGPHIPAASPEGAAAILEGGRIVSFKCANEHEADQLVGKLVDRVVVHVEVF